MAEPGCDQPEVDRDGGEGEAGDHRLRRAGPVTAMETGGDPVCGCCCDHRLERLTQRRTIRVGSVEHFADVPCRFATKSATEVGRTDVERVDPVDRGDVADASTAPANLAGFGP